MKAKSLLLVLVLSFTAQAEAPKKGSSVKDYVQTPESVQTSKKEAWKIQMALDQKERERSERITRILAQGSHLSPIWATGGVGVGLGMAAMAHDDLKVGGRLFNSKEIRTLRRERVFWGGVAAATVVAAIGTNILYMQYRQPNPEKQYSAIVSSRKSKSVAAPQASQHSDEGKIQKALTDAGVK